MIATAFFPLEEKKSGGEEHLLDRLSREPTLACVCV